MTWEERLLFLMFMDYKGALKKWERNYSKDKRGYLTKIDDENFAPSSGFIWCETEEGENYWRDLITQWNCLNSISVPSLEYSIESRLFSDTIQVGCQTITKKDALEIADFIYECFRENK